MSKRSFSFQYIVKPVGEECNNACVYCFYPQNRKLLKPKSEKMPLELAKKLIKDISAYEQEKKHKSTAIIWHGGEPLIAGIDFYKEVFDYQKSMPVSFRNSFQTNGELITQKWCDFFNRYKCSVGFSMDGPPKIHDRQRKTKSGLATSSEVLKGIRLCRKNGINVGVLCVITAVSSRYPETIADYFYSKGIRRFDFIPAYNHDKKTSSKTSLLNINPDRFSGFMKKIFDWYLKKDDPMVEIRIVSDVITQLFGGRATVCNMQGTVCGRFLTVYPDGGVRFCDDYKCGKFKDIGNVKKETLSCIVNSDKFKSLRKLTKDRLEKCKNCEVLEVCHGGCPRHWNKKGSYFCPYYKDFYYSCYEKVMRIFKDSGLRRKHKLAKIKA